MPKPFIIEFDNQLVIKNGHWLVCMEKNVKIAIPALRAAIRDINTVPRGHKFPVGKQLVGDVLAELWRDEKFTHISCLKELTVDFNKKYQELIKHLNS